MFKEEQGNKRRKGGKKKKEKEKKSDKECRSPFSQEVMRFPEMVESCEKF